MKIEIKYGSAVFIPETIEESGDLANLIDHFALVPGAKVAFPICLRFEVRDSSPVMTATKIEEFTSC